MSANVLRRHPRERSGAARSDPQTGANVDAKDDHGLTPLMYCAVVGSP